MYVCIQPWNTLYQGNSMDFTSLLSLACEKKKNSNKKINSATLLQFFMFFSLLYARSRFVFAFEMKIDEYKKGNTRR